MRTASSGELGADPADMAMLERMQGRAVLVPGDYHTIELRRASAALTSERWHAATAAADCTHVVAPAL